MSPDPLECVCGGGGDIKTRGSISLYHSPELLASRFQMIFYKCNEFKKAKDSQGMPNLNPRGMIGRIYVGDH